MILRVQKNEIAQLLTHDTLLRISINFNDLENMIDTSEVSLYQDTLK